MKYSVPNSKCKHFTKYKIYYKYIQNRHSFINTEQIKRYEKILLTEQNANDTREV